MRLLNRFRLLAIGRQRISSQPTISPTNASTTNVMIGLKKNITGRKNISDRRVENGPEQLPDQKGADLEDLVHVARDEADRRSLEIIHRKVQHLLEHVGRQLDVDVALSENEPEICRK